MTTQLDWCPDAVMLSPKLAFLAKHGLHTECERLPRGRIGPFDTRPWSCNNAGRTISGFGETEDEAIVYFCRTASVRHWLEDTAWMRSAQETR